MADNMKHTQNLMAFEMEALSLLFHFWANPKVDEARADYLSKKIPTIREGVAVGIGPGNHENYIPRELVYSEYTIIKESLNKVKKEYAVEDIPDLHTHTVDTFISFDCRVGQVEAVFEKPLPFSVNDLSTHLKELLEGQEKVSVIAHRIVANRLGCKPQKVKDAAEAKKEKRFETTQEQGLLVSAFLDIASLSTDEIQYDLLADILNTLFLTECPALFIYYLVRRMPKLVNKRLFLGDYKMDELWEFCQTVCTKEREFKYEPFIRLT